MTDTPKLSTARTAAEILEAAARYVFHDAHKPKDASDPPECPQNQIPTPLELAAWFHSAPESEGYRGINARPGRGVRCRARCMGDSLRPGPGRFALGAMAPGQGRARRVSVRRGTLSAGVVRDGSRRIAPDRGGAFGLARHARSGPAAASARAPSAGADNQVTAKRNAVIAELKAQGYVNLRLRGDRPRVWR